MKTKPRIITPVRYLSVLCFLGFVTGVLTIALWQENWLVSEGILEQKFIYKIYNVDVDKKALFFFCLGERLRAFFLLFLLSYSSVNVFVNSCFFFLHGLYAGSIIEVLAVRYGMQGIGIYAIMILPQGIFYTIGFIILGCWCLMVGKEAAVAGRYKRGEKIYHMEEKKYPLIAFIMVLSGVFCESYLDIACFLLPKIM